jgi:hypothetical protein
VADEEELVGRISAFLSSRRGADARVYAERLSALGRVAVVGGMVRDMARVGESGFCSDVDFVVEADPQALAGFMALQAVRRNRFGGYCVDGGSQAMDVWALEDTWANRMGLARTGGIEGLLGTTFFDWDAAIFFPSNNSVVLKDGYVEGLRLGVIELNLRETPNGLGAVARTLRALVGWRATLGPRLSEFLVSGLARFSAGEVEAAQAKAFGRVFVAAKDLGALAEAASAGVAAGVGICFTDREKTPT